jgi:hypothetical protein
MDMHMNILVKLNKNIKKTQNNYHKIINYLMTTSDILII